MENNLNILLSINFEKNHLPFRKICPPERVLSFYFSLDYKIGVNISYNVPNLFDV